MKSALKVWRRIAIHHIYQKDNYIFILLFKRWILSRSARCDQRKIETSRARAFKTSSRKNSCDSKEWLPSRSTIVDSNLAFEFTHVMCGLARIRVKPRSYPIDFGYRLEIDPNETIYLEIDYAPICEYAKSVNDKTCPVCKKKNRVIPIVYGLITFTNKKETKNYYRGGCVTYGCDPNWYCRRDNTKFWVLDQFIVYGILREDCRLAVSLPIGGKNICNDASVYSNFR